VAGSTFSGSYAAARGTTGRIDAGRSYNAWTANASRGYDRTFNTRAGGSVYNANTGRTTNWGSGSTGNDRYADTSGNVYKNTGGSWQQHYASGWSNASGDTSWADREAQARSAGGARAGNFASSFGGGSGGWASRFGGGGGFPGRGDFAGAGGGGWGGRFGGRGFRR
jgi:hypothetical protein